MKSLLTTFISTTIKSVEIRKFKICLIATTTFFCIYQTSCKKFVEVDAPVNTTNSAVVYGSDATAAAVLTGIYATISKNQLTTSSSGGITNLPLFTGLSSDELSLYVPQNQSTKVLLSYYLNSLSNSNVSGSDFWETIYPLIFDANSAIEGLDNSSSLTPSVKQQLLGEAKFIRALCYFYLTNLYGNVPLVLTSDYKINSLITRSNQSDVYKQITADLLSAQSLLSTTYLMRDITTATTERTSPTSWAATALLARVYLFNGDYNDAALQATAVLNNTSLYSITSLNNTFLKNNNEAIWQLQPVTSSPYTNTPDAKLFVLPATGPTTFTGAYPVYLSTNLINSFEPGDLRKSNWVGSVTVNGTVYYYPFKYKVSKSGAAVSEYSTVLRLGELYLIRAEAEANGSGSGISSAITDLNVIRNRAGLQNYSGPTDKNSIINAILHERQVELFTEWGHRWLDIKRTNAVNSIMTIVTPQKGNSWDPNQQLYPLPLTEVQRDPNLVQNAGY